jgi:N utilization substance protein B
MSDVLNIDPVEGGELYVGTFGEVSEVDYFSETLEGISRRKDEIDRLIAESVKNWRFDRISIVDKNILRLGIFELNYSGFLIPYPVAINEAVEIAKAFGAEESGAFINGVLDALGKQSSNERGTEN